jgi:hypothetical protein
MFKAYGAETGLSGERLRKADKCARTQAFVSIIREDIGYVEKGVGVKRKRLSAVWVAAWTHAAVVLTLLFIAIAVPNAAIAGTRCNSGKGCIEQINGPAPVTLPVIPVYGYAPIDWSLEYDRDYVFNTPQYQAISGFNGSGVYSPNNHTASTVKPKNKGNCQATGLLPASQTPGLGVMMKPEVANGNETDIQSGVQA